MIQYLRTKIILKVDILVNGHIPCLADTVHSVTSLLFQSWIPVIISTTTCNTFLKGVEISKIIMLLYGNYSHTYYKKVSLKYVYIHVITVESRYKANCYTAILVILRSAHGPSFFSKNFGLNN